MACESFVILTSLSPVKGLASGGGERGVILTRLSRPRERPRARFWKRLTLCEAFAFTWGAHGARLQNCFARAKGEAIDMPKACRGGASRPRRAARPLLRGGGPHSGWRASVPANLGGGNLPPPICGPRGPLPRPCCQWKSICLANGPAREQFCRHASCAPKGRAMAKRLGKRFHRRARGRAREVKGK